MSYPIHRLSKADLPADFWPALRPPEEIFVQGSTDALRLLHLLPERGLAVVGTRKPLQRSLLEVNRRLSRLAGERLIIVSGFAKGIDGAAHEAALGSGLPTVAVLGGGIDIDYPREHAELRRRILESGGLLISEHGPGVHPVAPYFILRNRLIAAWAKTVWVVEASHRSGALNTANWARQLGRACYATPCYPGDPALAGNQGLIEREHAIPLWSIQDLGQSWLELAGRPDQKPAAKRRRKSEGQTPLFGKVAAGFFHSDETHLAARISLLTAEQGGAQVTELLDWATLQGWAPQRFFMALQNGLQKRIFSEQNGLLLADSFVA